MEPTKLGVALAAWQVAGSTNEHDARQWVQTMRGRGATEAEVSEAWDAFQDAQEAAVKTIHSTPTPKEHVPSDDH